MVIGAPGGVDLVKLTNTSGDTALHKTVVTRNLQVQNILLDNGADPCARNARRETPADVAKRLQLVGPSTDLLIKAQQEVEAKLEADALQAEADAAAAK